MDKIDEIKQQRESIQKEHEEREIQIKELTKQVEAYDRELQRLQQNQQIETQELRDLWEKIQQKLSKVNDRVKFALEKVVNRCNPVKQQLHELQVSNKQTNGRLATLEIKESGTVSIEALMRIRASVGTRQEIHITEKARFDNGVVVLRIGMNDNGYAYRPEYDKDKDHRNRWEKYTGYMAFYKGKWIGFTGRRKAEHPGDTTHPYSYIVLDKEVLDIHNEKRMQYSKETVWGLRTTHSGYREWIKVIEKLTNNDLEGAIGLDLVNNARVWVDFSGI